MAHVRHGSRPVTGLPETAYQIRRDIAHRRSWLTPHDRTLPEYDDNNWGVWLRRFKCEHNEVLATYDGPTPPDRYNAEGRHQWWDGIGHTVASVAIEAARQHARAGNTTPLRRLPVRPRR